MASEETMLGRLSRSLCGAVGSASALAPLSPLLNLTRSMSLLKSPAVKQWRGQKAIEMPTQWQPFYWEGRWRKPQLSRRHQQLAAKEAIRAGEIKLEPTVMVPPPKFKGHKRELNRPVALASIAAKMEQMPKMIAEYRLEQAEKARKRRISNRFK